MCNEYYLKDNKIADGHLQGLTNDIRIYREELLLESFVEKDFFGNKTEVPMTNKVRNEIQGNRRLQKP